MCLHNVTTDDWRRRSSASCGPVEDRVLRRLRSALNTQAVAQDDRALRLRNSRLNLAFATGFGPAPHRTTAWPNRCPVDSVFTHRACHDRSLTPTRSTDTEIALPRAPPGAQAICRPKTESLSAYLFAAARAVLGSCRLSASLGHDPVISFVRNHVLSNFG